MATIEEAYRRDKAGFDVLLSLVRDAIMEAMEDTADLPRGKPREVNRELGIYTIQRRLKSVHRLLRKVERMRGEDGELTEKNYYQCIPDIVAARVVCLHPDDMLRIARGLKTMVEGRFAAPPAPLVKMRVRVGDFTTLETDKFQAEGFVIDDPSPVGYTSVHFVFSLGNEIMAKVEREDRETFTDLQRNVDVSQALAEVQLRTIVEEAWGEVDHATRYENETLSNDPELSSQFGVMAAYLQAVNHQIRTIRGVAARRVAGTRMCGASGGVANGECAPCDPP